MPLERRPSSCWRIVHSECSLGWGGQEHRVLAELAGFQRRGCPVWLLAPPTAQLNLRASAAGMAVVPLSVVKCQYPFTAVRLACWLRSIRAQIVNTHSSRDGWVVGLAARLARVPLLIRSRHIDVDYPNRWISRHAFTTFADHVLTTSDKITGHLRAAFALQPEGVSTVATGIDVQRFSPDGPRMELPELSHRPRLPVIGMVSVLRSWKGHSTFLAAAKLLLDAGLRARFVIVGDGPQRNNLQAQIAALGLGGAVVLTGHREDVPEVLRALSALVIASTKHEGVPQIGLQALACKTPVVGSDAGGTPEIIRHGETGRNFPAGDPKALAAAISDTLSAREETAAMSERGRATVEQHHSLDTMLDRLEVIYRRHLC